jgi:hypothetical protein
MRDLGLCPNGRYWPILLKNSLPVGPKILRRYTAYGSKDTRGQALATIFRHRRTGLVYRPVRCRWTLRRSFAGKLVHVRKRVFQQNRPVRLIHARRPNDRLVACVAFETRGAGLAGRVRLMRHQQEKCNTERQRRDDGVECSVAQARGRSAPSQAPRILPPRRVTMIEA